MKRQLWRIYGGKLGMGLLRSVALLMMVGLWFGCGETTDDASNQNNAPNAAQTNDVGVPDDANGISDGDAGADTGGELGEDAGGDSGEDVGGDTDEDAGDDVSQDPTDIAGLVFDEQPEGEVTAGEPFDVRVQLVDDSDQNVAVDGVDVALTLTEGLFSSGDGDVTAETGDAGVAEFDGLRIEHTGVDLRLVAAAEGGDSSEIEAESTAFEVIDAGPSAEESWIGGEDGVVADGDTEAEITVEIRDEFGNAVPGVVPTFEATGAGNDYEDCAGTDEDGIAACAMTSTESGEKTLSITDPVEVTGETIEFTIYWDCNPGMGPFGGGTGASNDPHRLCTPEHLNAVGTAEGHMSDAFVVADDIDMSSIDEFNMIGDGDTPFAGEFDGNHHTISNLTIHREDDETGMFTEVLEGTRVERIVLENVDVKGNRRTGALVGKNEGEIVDCHVLSGDVLGMNVRIGGLVGRNHGKISESSSRADVAGERSVVGGLVGKNAGTIVNSYATGEVTGEVGSVGGLVGTQNNGGEVGIRSSFATGEVSSDRNAVGGLVGNFVEGVVEDSFAMGNVSSYYGHAGGLIGLIGHMDATVSYVDRSYATGNVTADEEGSTTIGGVIGSIRFSSAEVGEVKNSYWDVQTSAVSTSSGTGYEDQASPLNTDEFDDEENFEDWDFDEVWRIDTAPDDETRPVPQWWDGD